MVASNTTISNNISNNFICLLSACQNCCTLVEQNSHMQHNETLQMIIQRVAEEKGSDKHSSKSSRLRFKAMVQLLTILTSKLCFKDGQNPAQHFVVPALNHLSSLTRRVLRLWCLATAA